MFLGYCKDLIVMPRRERQTALANAGQRAISGGKPQRRPNHCISLTASNGEKSEFPVRGVGVKKKWEVRDVKTTRVNFTTKFEEKGASVYANVTETRNRTVLVGTYSGDTKGLTPQGIAQAVVDARLQSAPDALDLFMEAKPKKPSIDTSAVSFPQGKKTAWG